MSVLKKILFFDKVLVNWKIISVLKMVTNKKVQFYQGNAFMLRVSNLTFGVPVRLQNFTLLN